MYISNILPVRMKRASAALPGALHDWEFDWDEDSLGYQAKSGIEQPQAREVKVRRLRRAAPPPLPSLRRRGRRHRKAPAVAPTPLARPAPGRFPTPPPALSLRHTPQRRCSTWACCPPTWTRASTSP